MKREELFNQALRENSQTIMNICKRILTSDEDAKDAFQEVLLKIWNNIEKFRGECKLKTWVTRISVNVSINCLHRYKKKSFFFIPFSKDIRRKIETSFAGNNSSDNEENPDNLDHEKKAFLEKFISELKTVDRIVVSLYLEGFDAKEISASTGISESNVRVKTHRVKKQLKEEWSRKNGTQ